MREFAFLLGIGCASAVSAQESHAWAGLGMASCVELQADSNIYVLTAAYAHWAWGFFSGLNSEIMKNHGVYRNLAVFRSEREIFDALEDECSRSGWQNVMLAAAAVFDRLSISTVNSD